MPGSCRNQLSRSLRRRLLAGLALVAYLAAAVGFPVAAVPAASGLPFPCQHHGCGCRSAEECWRHCCCFTPEQRWSWAEAHHVEPPAYAEKPATAGWHTPRLRDLAEGKPCCSRCAEPATASCCATGDSSNKNARPQSGSRGSTGLSALQCRGVSTLWVSTGAVVAPPRPLTWSPCIIPEGWLTAADSSAPQLRAIPPDPPPRSVCV